MYGFLVGTARQTIPKGTKITTENTLHATQGYQQKRDNYTWKAPDITKWKNRTFMGYPRMNGKFIIHHSSLTTHNYHIGTLK